VLTTIEPGRSRHRGRSSGRWPMSAGTPRTMYPTYQSERLLYSMANVMWAVASSERRRHAPESPWARCPVAGPRSDSSGGYGHGQWHYLIRGLHPYHRLQRKLIEGGVATGGTRSVASYDEDTRRWVEAARRALAVDRAEGPVDRLYFATSYPAYLDKTNATAVHAALGLSRAAGAYDLGGAVRSGIGAIRAAADGAAAGRHVLAVTSDVRNGLAGSGDEADGGDAAAAFVFGSGAVLATLIGESTTTDEILDRWRAPGELGARRWEPRFAEDALVSLAEDAVAEAFKEASLSPGQVDHLIVCGSHDRAIRRLRKSIGTKADAVADDLGSVLGNSAAAQPGVILADVLDRAQPGQVVVLVTVADGRTY